MNTQYSPDNPVNIEIFIHRPDSPQKTQKFCIPALHFEIEENAPIDGHRTFTLNATMRTPLKTPDFGADVLASVFPAPQTPPDVVHDFMYGNSPEAPTLAPKPSPPKSKLHTLAGFGAMPETPTKDGMWDAAKSNGDIQDLLETLGRKIRHHQRMWKAPKPTSSQGKRRIPPPGPRAADLLGPMDYCG